MFEIRNYHFEPSLFDEYKPWAESGAVPFLKKKMDIVGFWVTNDEPPEIAGPLADKDGIGPSNITWIIRWDDMAQRDRIWAEVRSHPEWTEFFTKVPGGRQSYLKTEVKFADEI